MNKRMTKNEIEKLVPRMEYPFLNDLLEFGTGLGDCTRYQLEVKELIKNITQSTTLNVKFHGNWEELASDVLNWHLDVNQRSVNDLLKTLEEKFNIERK